jgi:hypothetical protein
MLKWFKRKLWQKPLESNYEASPHNLSRSSSQQPPRISYDLLALVISLAAAVFTGYQAYLTHESLSISKKAQDSADQQGRDTLKEMAHQTSQMRSQSDAQTKTAGALVSSAEASIKSLNASRESIRIARQSLEESQELDRQDRRAWLGAIRTGYHPDDTLQRFAVEIGVTNVGRTPALRVVIRTAITTENRGIVPLNLFRLLKREEKSAVILPGQTEAVGLEVGVGDWWDAKAFVERRKSVYLFGVLDYRDVFDKQHQTTFCYEIVKGLQPNEYPVNPCNGELNSAN